ncbi:reverse transcriptase domain-containing protein [Tanacetum coccineum]
MKSKHSRDDYLYCFEHTAKLVQEQWVNIIDHDGEWTEEEGDDPNKVFVVSFYPRTEPVEPLEWIAPKNRLKPSSVEPPKLELKELSKHLEYNFLQENNQLLVVISSALSSVEKTRLLEVLQNHKGAIAWRISDIKGIDSSFCTHKILMEDEFKPSVQPQRRVNLNIKEVVKKEVIKVLDAGLIYPIFDSPWVSHIQVVLKKGEMTIVKNEKDELIPQRMVTGSRVCIDYRKLNNATRKDHFSLPFIDQILERLAGHEYYCFLDGFSGYFQILVAPEDQEKTTFTCPYGTFAYKQMPFGLCNALATFQRCMTAIFHELIKDSMDVFMDDILVFGSSFDHCLKNLEKMLKRCEETNLVLNWQKCHFMVRKESSMAIRSQVLELRRFIKDFSQIARPMTQLLVKDASSNFSEECIQAFDTLKRELTQAPIMIKPNWSLPFKIMCDAKFDIEIRNKEGAENIAADHLSRLENPDLGKLTSAEIRDLFPEEQLMAISDKNDELCVLTESYEDAWPEKRQHKFFNNVTADHPKDIMTLPPLQERSLRPGFKGHISFAMHISSSRLYNSPIHCRTLDDKAHDRQSQLLCNYCGENFCVLYFIGNDQFVSNLGYGDRIKKCPRSKDLQGNDLLTGNHRSDLYTISLQETTSSTPICFMAKASPTQAWLWHRRLSHLNFDYITLLSKKDIVTGLPKLK